MVDKLKEQFYALRDEMKVELLRSDTHQPTIDRIKLLTRSTYERIAELDPWFEFQFLKIQDKDANILPFIPYSTQTRIMEEVMAQEIAGVPVRLILLKPRQFGGNNRNRSQTEQRQDELRHMNEPAFPA